MAVLPNEQIANKMWLTILCVLAVVPAFEFAHLSPHCSEERTLYILRRSTYEFSVKLLDRVLQDTDGHFVFSPLSTWVQLTALAEGATGHTLREIWKITRHHRRLCLKRQWRKVVNVMMKDLRSQLKLQSVMVIDRLLGVKHKFLKEIKQLNSMKVLLFNFDNAYRAAREANEYIESATDGQITDVIFPQDFNLTALLTVDAMYYKSAWKFAFNPSYTSVQTFYSGSGEDIGEVNMMKQLGYFNITEIPIIESKVLELPCGDNDRLTLLIFLPKKGDSIWNIYFYMQRMKLLSIFRLFKKDGVKLVNVEIPRFKVTTDVDNIPELLYDMGVRSLFRPDTARLDGISDYSIYASLMTQVSDIEITEEGVEAKSIAENLVNDGKSLDFIANKPFVFMLVDRKLEVMLFAGAYSVPSLY